MDGKVGEESVPFRSHKGEPRFLHIVKHLAEYAEVKVGGIKRLISEARNGGNRTEGESSHTGGENNGCLFRHFYFFDKIFVFTYKVEKNKRVNKKDGERKEDLPLVAPVNEQPLKRAKGIKAEEQKRVRKILLKKSGYARIAGKNQKNDNKRGEERDVLHKRKIKKVDPTERCNKRISQPRGNKPTHNFFEGKCGRKNFFYGSKRKIVHKILL